MTGTTTQGSGQDFVIITGPAGAGRSTATGILEDLGFEAIDNLPQSLLPHLFGGPPINRPVVVGIDPRNREFDVASLLQMLGEPTASTGRMPVLVYLDCDPDVLIRRYSETRRRHPLSPQETPMIGITREIQMLTGLRERADVLVDTSAMTPHDLRAEMTQLFGGDGRRGGLVVSLHSFSYKLGTPRGADMVIDVRFLKNPHWDPELRPLDGRDAAVQAFVAKDPNFAPFRDRMLDMLRFLLPAYRDEGKSYFGIGLGCTGGRHRSVMMVELLGKALAEDGWDVSTRHRDLGQADAAPATGTKVGRT